MKVLDENKFFSLIELDLDQLELEEDFDEPVQVEIEMLRVGDFKHKKYGELKITETLLEGMIKNFKDNVIGREVSFDWNHEAKDASAWLKDLKLEDGVLVGTTELTAKGAKSVASKEYGYFSIEYTDDYEDPETEKAFGPTILGGALTNRPFISKLKRIEFSINDDDEDSSIFRTYSLKKEDVVMDKVKKEPVVDATVELTLEDAKKQLEAQALEIKTLKEAKPPKDIEVTVIKPDERVEVMLSTHKKMEDRLATLEAEKDALAKKLTSSEQVARTEKIERICDKLLAEDHQHPAVVSVAKQIMLSDTGDQTIKLSETVKDGENEKTIELEVTIRDAVLKILSSIPNSQRADYTEKTSTADEKTLTEAEQEKLEKEAMGKVFGRRKLSAVK
jgi:hypothetical protein